MEKSKSKKVDFKEIFMNVAPTIGYLFVGFAIVFVVMYFVGIQLGIWVLIGLGCLWMYYDKWKEQKKLREKEKQKKQQNQEINNPDF